MPASLFTYGVDVWQRSVLFLDILRERAENMLEHERAGLPPLLHFDYETVLDAREFSPPANYMLLRITAREHHSERFVDPAKAPVIIVDPRAGHGPGIGGFKRDSEVGVALEAGHTTYFVGFYPEPCPGQTLGDVLHALRRFVNEVSRRHGGTAPIVYGNCQAGWAVALLAADCGGLAGPTVLNGSPLSYWAGEAGVNPMRLGAGLLGGSWLAHYAADLGNGRFDGAWLAQNFESLDPARTLWDKNYKVFMDPDGERERFLAFERWWCGYYELSREEITEIVNNLFVANGIERGLVRVCPCCFVDLRRIRNPIVIFASSSDNITPPHQALNWLPAVYPSTAELKAAKQRVVYLLNHQVGHLGIFVSADVARREHRMILDSLPKISSLAPGLYEMKIIRGPTQGDGNGPGVLDVAFEERGVEDIRFAYPRADFERVEQVSNRNAKLYTDWVSPWVRAGSNPVSAAWLKWLHPMRVSRYVFSAQVNPAMYAVEALACAVRTYRERADADNPALALEKALSEQISTVLDTYRHLREQLSETLFELAYGSRDLNAAWSETKSPAEIDSARRLGTARSRCARGPKMEMAARSAEQI